MKLFAFQGGEEIWDKSILTMQHDIGLAITIPIQFFLVEHPAGRVMFDTGLHPDHIFNVDRVRRQRPWKTIVGESELAPARLAEIGLTPRDVRYVANSHLHYDHAGGNCFFSHAIFLCQFDELRAAMWPEKWLRRNYDRTDFDLPVTFEELDGDHDIFGDGRVKLVKMPGHTPGSQVMILKLEKTGTVVLAQDAIYLQQNLEEGILPTNLWNPSEMMRSYQRLRDLRRLHDARVIPGHDIQIWRELRHAPECYE